MNLKARFPGLGSRDERSAPTSSSVPPVTPEYETSSRILSAAFASYTSVDVLDSERGGALLVGIQSRLRIEEK